MERDLSWEELNEHTLWKFSQERELVCAIDELSHLYTKNRAALGQDSLDPKLVSAYTLFYLPTNYKKFFYLKSMLGEKLWEEITTSTQTFYDIGSGPGTFLLAYLDSLSSESENEFSTKLWSLEADRNMQAQSKKIMQHYWPQKNIQFTTSPAALPSSQGGMACFGHSLNEMETMEAQAILEKIQPQWVIFIEPGTPLSFQKVLDLRKWLFSQGYHVEWPCPGSGPCPMETTTNWCHQLIRAKWNPSMGRLFQLAKKDRFLMPATIHLYQKRLCLPNLSTQAGSTQGRLVRVLRETKFGHEVQVCVWEGESPENLVLEIMKKNQSKNFSKTLAQFPLGMTLTYQVIKELPSGILRVKVLEEDKDF